MSAVESSTSAENLAAATPAPPPPPADPRADLGFAFKAATGAVRRLRGRETRRPDGLSYAQYSLLFSLDQQRELPTSQLAALADLAPGTATEMLDHLEAHGLVARTRSSLDKRTVLISLTERGSELVRARRQKFEHRWEEALTGFGDDELRTAAAVLERLSHLFDSFDGSE
jgi:DNA-binding MarR family transcriptional regulator